MEVRGRAARVALAVVLVAAVGLPAFPGADAQRDRFERTDCDPAGGSGGCPGGSSHNGTRTCYEAAHRICLVHDLPDDHVAVDPDAECVQPRSPHAPDDDPSITVRSPATNATLCIGVSTTPRIPGFGVEPPDAGDLGRTTVAGCERGDGATVIVVGVGGTVCVEVTTSGGGETFDLDLTPCPGGTDPRVDLAGQRVTICLIVGTSEDLPDPDAGDVDMPYPIDLLPDTRNPCRSPVGLQAEALDVSGTVCLSVEPLRSPNARGCRNGTGAVTFWGTWEIGGCLA